MAVLWLFVAVGYLLLYAFAAIDEPLASPALLRAPEALDFDAQHLDNIALARIDTVLSSGTQMPVALYDGFLDRDGGRCR